MIGWVDASSGASGDMLLGALLGTGVPLNLLQDSVDAVLPGTVSLGLENVTRRGLAATRCRVTTSDSAGDRRWSDIRAMLATSHLPEPARGHALRVFERLAVAEGAVHGISADDVHFHEVGALDAIADVVGVCAGLAHLGLESLVVSPVAVGSGTVHTSHGALPVPAPAVAELLRGAPTHAGAGQDELCTPTGAALLTSFAASYSAQPAMTVDVIGVGAGERDPDTHPNVVRLFVGEPAPPAAGSGHALVIETNVDDLDPRLWPDVISALLAAGASDAWLSPILMKKGRPAHTLHVLTSVDQASQVRAEVFRQTSTIGVRELLVAKTSLDREMLTVHVAGQEIRVKRALLDGEVVNAQPEYVDVAAVAARTGRPVKDVLAEAAAAARRL